MIVEVAENVTVEIFQSVRYKPGKGYVYNDVLGYKRVHVLYWHEPIMGGWRWVIGVTPQSMPQETLVMGVLRDTLEECVIAAYRVIETEHFAKMLTAWPVESLK